MTMNYSSGFLGHKGMKRGAIFNLLFFFLPKRMDCFSVVHLRRRSSGGGTTREEDSSANVYSSPKTTWPNGKGN